MGFHRVGAGGGRVAADLNHPVHHHLAAALLQRDVKAAPQAAAHPSVTVQEQDRLSTAAAVEAQWLAESSHVRLRSRMWDPAHAGGDPADATCQRQRRQSVSMQIYSAMFRRVAYMTSGPQVKPIS